MTYTCTDPVPAGAVAEIVVPAVLMFSTFAAAVPKSTVDPEENPVPVIVTVAPLGPEVGLMAVTVREYEKLVLAFVADVPAGVVTVTETVPVPAGDVAVIEVSLTTLKVVATLVPKWTLLAPVNPDPVIYTFVPPLGGPEVGVIEVIALTAIPLKASPLVSTAAQ